MRSLILFLFLGLVLSPQVEAKAPFGFLAGGTYSGMVTTSGIMTATDNALGSLIALPPSVDLQVDLPLTDSTSVTDQSGKGHSPSPWGSPSIRSSITRPGKTYAAYTPGYTDGQSIGHWTWADAAWNRMQNGNFAIEAWVYLPSSAGPLTGYANQLNTVCGGGGPDSGEPAFGVGWVAGQPKLQMQNAFVAVLSSSVFPLNQWVHCAVVHTASPLNTKLYQNGVLVANDGSVVMNSGGTNFSFNLGSREFNSIWACGWGGYISNFRFYHAN